MVNRFQTFFWTLTALGICPCSGFTNLNFESGIVTSGAAQTFVNWNTAAPNWIHSSGSDTSFLYHGSMHLGISQWYILADSTIPEVSLTGNAPTEANEPLEGRFSMMMKSGYSDNQSSLSPWVNAFVSQTGSVPLSSQSIRLFGTGTFQLFMNNTQVPLIYLGGNIYGGDVSAYAGTTAELKIMDSATSLSPYAYSMVDGISFSPLSVPEPSRAFLLCLGASALFRRRRS